MGPTPAPGPEAGPTTGSLARVLARAALPPVAVPSGYAGESRPVVRAAFLDPPTDGRPAAPSSVPRVVATQQIPAAVSVPGEVAALADPSPSPTGTVTWPPAPDVVAMEEEHSAAPAEARTAPPAQLPPTESFPGPVASLTSTPGAAVTPLAAAAAQSAVEPGDPPGHGPVVGTREPVPMGIDQPDSQVTRVSRSAPERPDRTDTPAPTPSAPPVAIGRIEVHVDSPAAQADPFAGCRIVAAGLTARRGGGW
jgi:hypothetical protein